MFTCIFEQVAGALGMLTGAQNLFESAVVGVAKAIVGQVTGGIWKGNGANKFVEMVIPSSFHSPPRDKLIPRAVQIV
jgi:hypothetical protein